MISSMDQEFYKTKSSVSINTQTQRGVPPRTQGAYEYIPPHAIIISQYDFYLACLLMLWTLCDISLLPPIKIHYFLKEKEFFSICSKP